MTTNFFGRRFFWQTGGNRLSKQGDTAKVVLVAPARPAGFEHGGLRQLHGPADGAGAEHVSRVVRAQGARGGGVQPEISHELSQTICGRWPAAGAAVLSRRRAGGLSSEVASTNWLEHGRKEFGFDFHADLPGASNVWTSAPRGTVLLLHGYGLAQFSHGALGVAAGPGRLALCAGGLARTRQIHRQSDLFRRPGSARLEPASGRTGA